MEQTNDQQETYITKQGRAHYLIDEGANRIEFLDNRFYLEKKSGDMVPSVTTILEAWPKGPGFYKWLKEQGDNADVILDKAGEQGSIVHELTEIYDRGAEVRATNEVGEPRYRMAEWAMLERYVEFRERFAPSVLQIERNMVSSKLGYAGTLDRVMSFGGDLWLIDIKTSSSVWDHMHLQTAAYTNLFCELEREAHPDPAKIRRGILHLNAKTRTSGKGDAIQGKGWQLVESPNPFDRDMELFAACMKMWHAVNANTKPRNLSYQLSHKLP